MKNLFDDVPDQEPETLRIGSSWRWTRSDITGAYPTTEYTLSYTFTNLDVSNTTFTITAAKTNDEHTVEVNAITTSGYTAGEYQWVPKITRDSDGAVVLLDAGDTTVEPEDPTQSYAYRVLIAIRATLEKTASKEQQQYSIAGRQLIRRSTKELQELEQEFQRRVERERQARKRKMGRAARKRTLVQLDA